MSRISGMNIAIDVREACKEQRTGKGQWVFGFVSELLTRNHSLILLNNAPLPKQWQENEQCRTKYLNPGWKWHLSAARYLQEQRKEIDVYISPTSYIAPSLLGSSIPCVPVVHDLIAFQREPHNAKAKWIERILLGRTIRCAHRVCTVSNATKLDLHKQYPSFPPSKAATVYAGPFTTEKQENVPDDHTILCIATLCPRKNQKRLIEAYAHLPQVLRLRYKLVLVGGRGWHDSDIVQLANKTTGVEYKGYCSQEECEELLKTCTVFAYPSLYEGFGMPILDAMKLGIPVVTSNRGSLKEVAGDAALTVDPTDTISIMKGLEEILTNTDLQNNLRAKGKKQADTFSWKKTVDLFLESIDQIT